MGNDGALLLIKNIILAVLFGLHGAVPFYPGAPGGTLQAPNLGFCSQAQCCSPPAPAAVEKPEFPVELPPRLSSLRPCGGKACRREHPAWRPRKETGGKIKGFSRSQLNGKES